jgi:hypothetical protein
MISYYLVEVVLLLPLYSNDWCIIITPDYYYYYHYYYYFRCAPWLRAHPERQELLRHHAGRRPAETLLLPEQRQREAREVGGVGVVGVKIFVGVGVGGVGEY